MTMFPLLLTPIQIRGKTMRNRIFSTGHIPGFTTAGLPDDRMTAYHEEKARGGLGLTVISGSTSVSPESPAAEWGMITNHDERVVPRYRAIAEAVHAHGALVLDQITHMGRRGHSEGGSWLPLLAPSDVPEPLHREIPHVLEEEQILRIVRDFGAAAARCEEAGLDGVEISAAHNHLIDQFWAPESNLRTDQWGGSLDNRLRFCFMVLDEVRRQTGSDFIIGIRISADEMREGSGDPAERIEIARRLAKSGLLDFIDVIGGSAATMPNIAAVVPDITYPDEPNVRLARAVKDVVDLPVFHAGKIQTPEAAERLLREGLFDVVGMTRAQIADPHMANKARDGVVDQIRTCVGANYCLNSVQFGRAVTCIQNVAIGRERELARHPVAASPRRVVVIGGGPGGLEAARVAALRGHRVTLVERQRTLGGQVRVFANAPRRGSMLGIVDWLEREVKRLGVEVIRGAEATADEIADMAPDSVVIATGGRPFRPELPGFDAPNVFTASEVLEGRDVPGPRVLVIDDDAYYTGPAVADLLAGRGHQVEITTRLTHIGEDLASSTLSPILTRLFAQHVVMTPHVLARSVREGTVTLENVYTGEQEQREVDAVVLAMGNRAVDSLYHGLKGRVPELHLIGDAMAPRRLHTAMLEGARVARAI